MKSDSIQRTNVEQAVAFLLALPDKAQNLSTQNNRDREKRAKIANDTKPCPARNL
ncbi:MAG: hypothetical protein HC866_06585 [Leptolyngbyaceae cyanobacterium RU_5_1]|nr:hypothetical protein [Leptolyngbyaceae cyanobacterium RU_5_1]